MLPSGRVVLTSAGPDVCELVVLGYEDRKLAGLLVAMRAAVLGEIGDQVKRGVQKPDVAELLELRGPSIMITAGPMAGAPVSVAIGVRVIGFDVAGVVEALERNFQAIAWIKTSGDRGPRGTDFAMVGFW